MFPPRKDSFLLLAKVAKYRQLPLLVLVTEQDFSDYG
jgi:hypothetical protein